MATFRRAQVETLVSRLLEPPERLIAIFGPRQSGKTTAARQALEAVPHERRFLAIDQPDSTSIGPPPSGPRLPAVSPGAPTSRSQRDIGWLVDTWAESRQRAWTSNRGFVLVLDEIQRIEGWSDAVKGLWDADRASGCPLHVVIMGSAPLLMQSGLTESLAGRFEPIQFTHWSYSEMADAFGFSLDEYVYFGGYPGATRYVDDQQRWATYVKEALIEPNIERDVLSMTRVDKPALLRRLFELGALFSGQVLSYNKMLGQLQDAGNATTLARYLKLLSDAGLLTGLAKHTERPVSAKASTPKLNVLNTALMAVTSRYSFEEAQADRTLWGRLVESAVGAHLVNTASPMTSVKYWRDRHFEVDFVLHRGPHTVGIEVKSGAAPAPLKGIAEFERRFSPRNTIVVGATGVPLSEFLSHPADHWIDSALAESEPIVACHLLEEAFRNRENPTTGEGMTLDVMRRRVCTGPLARQLDDLSERNDQVRSEDDELDKKMADDRAEHFEAQRQQQEEWASLLRSELDDLLTNRFAAPNLHTLAQACLGMFIDLDEHAPPRQRICQFVGGHEDLVEPVMAAIREAAFRNDVPTVDKTIALNSESKHSWMAYPVLASLQLLEEENPSRLDQIEEGRKREALAIRFCVAADTTPGRWHRRWLQQNPEMVVDVLVRCATHEIRRGDHATVCLNTLNWLTGHDDLVQDARLQLIDAIPLRAPNMQMNLLDSLLTRPMRHPDKAAILKIARKKLSLKSLVVAQRVRWLAVDALLAPSPNLSSLRTYVGMNDTRVRHLAEFLRRSSRNDDMSRTVLADVRYPDALRDMIEVLGPSFPPAHGESGAVSLGMEMSDLISQLINQLGAVPGPNVDRALTEMAHDPRLGPWRDWLNGAQERQRVVSRDTAYNHASIDEIHRTLSSGAPANAADLAALLVDRFEEISKHLRGDNSNPWRHFWSDDRTNPPTEPKHEETCRDALLGMLNERLPEDIEAAPEGRYAADTRADIRFGCAGFNVPVEIKKNSHRELWSALRRQLIDRYTTDPDTSGYGVYVVLWFGPNETRTAPDGGRPNTPEKLRQRLEQDLTPDEARKISVVVLDVTKPGGSSR